MPLTQPADYPLDPRSGVDPRDAGKDITKPPLKIYLKPFTQKIVEKGLWVEVIAVIMVVVTGISEAIGRTLSEGWYFALGVLITLMALRFLKKEEIGKPLPPPVAEPEEKK